MSWDWLINNWLGVAALSLSGLGFWRDYLVHRAQAAIEITKLHRDLWTRYDDRPELHGLFDKARDLGARPLTSEEIRFANFLFLHIRATYIAERSGIYVQPERLREDLRSIFVCPAPRSAWEKMKEYHDCAFVAFIDNCLTD